MTTSSGSGPWWAGEASASALGGAGGEVDYAGAGAGGPGGAATAQSSYTGPGSMSGVQSYANAQGGDGGQGMGAGYSGGQGGAASSSTPENFDSSLTYSLFTGGISNPQHLLVGLLDQSFSGSDFVSLEFWIYVSGHLSYHVSFTDPAQARSFFDDRILDLGLLSDIMGGSSYLDLAFYYSLVASNNTEFDFNFIYGNGNPVPLPAAVWLFGSGLAGLLVFRRKFFA